MNLECAMHLVKILGVNSSSVEIYNPISKALYVLMCEINRLNADIYERDKRINEEYEDENLEECDE